jgi:cytochrome c oxidase cbb3-type subunit I/II
MEGRDIYIREGCVGCHSQMVRPFRSETEDMVNTLNQVNLYTTDRSFGVVSVLVLIYTELVENIRTAGIITICYDPTSMAPGSIMPPYPWLHKNDLNTSYTASKIKIITVIGNTIS